MQPTGNKHPITGKDEYLAPDGVSKVYLAPDEFSKLNSLVGGDIAKPIMRPTPQIPLAPAPAVKPVGASGGWGPGSVTDLEDDSGATPESLMKSSVSARSDQSGGMASITDSQRTSKIIPKAVKEAEVQAAKSSMNAIDAQAKAAEAVSTATALKAEEDARLSQKFLEEEKVKQVQEQSYIDKKQAELDAISADYSNMSIDNNNFWASKSTGDSILAALAIGLGAFADVGSGRGESQTLKILQSKIDQDIETQKANIAKAGNNVSTQRGLFSDVLKRTGDERLARLKTHEMGLKSALAQFDQTIAASNNQLLQAKYQQEKANIENALVQNQIAQADTLVTESKSVPIATPKPSVGEETFDKKVSETMESWLLGDRNTTLSNLDLMEKSLQKIENNPDWVSGRFIGRMPDLLRSDLSLQVEQDIRKAAQSSLKATLGSQFTAQEGERIMNFAFDPKLTPAQNIEKLRSDIKAIKDRQQSLDSKAKFYLENGRSMRNWKGEDLFQSAPAFKETTKPSTEK